MLTAISVRHLKPGDKFIWSDDPQHDPATLFDHAQPCLNCGDTFGRHHGMRCRSTTRWVDTFVPDDRDTKAPKAVDDFFASLGL